MLQDILKARGFRCKMIRTYTTKTVEDLTAEQQAAAAAAEVVTFASPSAIKYVRIELASHLLTMCIRIWHPSDIIALRKIALCNFTGCQGLVSCSRTITGRDSLLNVDRRLLPIRKSGCSFMTFLLDACMRHVLRIQPCCSFITLPDQVPTALLVIGIIAAVCYRFQSESEAL